MGFRMPDIVAETRRRGERARPPTRRRAPARGAAVRGSRGGAEEYRETEARFRGGGPLAARLEALAKGVRPAPDEGFAVPPPAGEVQAAEPARIRQEEASHGTARARQESAFTVPIPVPVAAEAAPADGDRAFGGQAPAPPDGAGIVHWAIREAALERLRAA